MIYSKFEGEKPWCFIIFRLSKMQGVRLQKFYSGSTCLSDLKLPAGGVHSARRFVDPCLWCDLYKVPFPVVLFRKTLILVSV